MINEVPTIENHYLTVAPCPVYCTMYSLPINNLSMSLSSMLGHEFCRVVMASE